jgi:hypothetical protein
LHTFAPLRIYPRIKLFLFVLSGVVVEVVVVVVVAIRVEN